MKKKTQAPVNPNEENETQEVQVSKGRKILNTVVNVILVVALVMAILSPIMAALGQSSLYNSTEGGLKNDGQ